jgi:hypothetical protein
MWKEDLLTDTIYDPVSFGWTICFIKINHQACFILDYYTNSLKKKYFNFLSCPGPKDNYSGKF